MLSGTRHRTLCVPPLLPLVTLRLGARLFVLQGKTRHCCQRWTCCGFSPTVPHSSHKLTQAMANHYRGPPCASASGLLRCPYGEAALGVPAHPRGGGSRGGLPEITKRTTARPCRCVPPETTHVTFLEKALGELFVSDSYSRSLSCDDR
jgi:hypothetical protein